MNILITGSNGFIGRSIADKLKKDHILIGCGRKPSPVSDVDDYVQWDIGREDVPRGLVDRKIEAVIHAASSKSTDDGDLELSYANVAGTHRVMNLCRSKKCERAILISGIPILHRSDQQGNQGIREDAPYDPPTMYHATKAAQELMFKQLEKYAVHLAILRVPSPIAPVMSERTIFTIFGDHALAGRTIMLHGRGTRRQNYIDTRDIAAVCEKVLLSDDAKGVYNLGAKQTVSNRELAEKWIRVTGSKSKIEYSGQPDPADKEDWRINTCRIQTDFGYAPAYSIEQTMKEYMEAKICSQARIFS